jgi:hypothetical protein
MAGSLSRGTGLVLAFLASQAIGACGGNGGTGPSSSITDASTDSGTATDGTTTASESGAPLDASSDGSETTEASPGTPDSSLPDADSGVVPVNPNPTVSSWMGTNIAADLPWVDVTYMLSTFDTPAAQQDANGYPVAGVAGTSSTDVGWLLPSGTYDVSYQGTGSLTVSGIGKLVGTWQTAGGEQRAQIQITGTPGAFGNFLSLKIANGPGQTVTAIHIYVPGVDYDSPAVFTPQFLRLLTPFRALRFMDWIKTNNSTLKNWADRPAAAHFGASPSGNPYEHIALLANLTGKDIWINVPENATDAFVKSFADFLAANLDFQAITNARNAAGFTTPFQIILENSNETWNGGFSAYATFLAVAKANPTRYTGAYDNTYGPSWMVGLNNGDLMKVGQVDADRLVHIASIFRQELTPIGKQQIVSPVLSGWALGAAYSDVGLQFVKANYGDPKTLIRYVALAPYFSTPDDTSTGALGTLFTALGTAIAGADSAFADFAKLSQKYGISIAAYEGGQGLTGATHQPIKHLAQHDVRMYQAYQSAFALWKMHFGPSLYMHFSLAGDPGQPENIYQYGFWASIIGAFEDPATCEPNLPMLAGTETIDSVVHHCPKYRALAEQVP